MPDRIARKCSTIGCGTFGTFKGGRCPAHTSSGVKDRKAGRILDTRWTTLCATIDAYNKVCQRIGPCPGEPEWNMRCRQPGKFHHHLLDAQLYPQFELNQYNIVVCCASCHPNPAAADQGRFVPTLWRTPMTDEALPDPLVLPGGLVTRELEPLLWSVDERRRHFGVERSTGIPG